MSVLLNPNKMEASSPRIPPEVVCLIFEKMKIRAIKRCRQVCSEWQHLLDRFFIRTNILISNETYAHVKRSGLEAHTITVKDFSENCSGEGKTFSRCSLARNAKHIIFASPMCEAAEAKLRRQAQDNMTLVLTLNPAIETLVFEENSLKLVNSLNIRGISFQNLTCLSIDFSYATDRKVFQDLVQARFPALKSVQLSEYWSEFGPETGRGYVGMYQFLANHKETLRYVTLVHPMRSQDMSASDAQLLPPPKMEILLKDLAEIQLASLYLYFVSIEGAGCFTLGGHLLQSQRSLIKLQVAIGGNYFYCLPQVKNAITRNSSTLEYVSLLSHEQWGVFVSLTDSLSPLSSCSKLETFEVDHFFLSFLPELPPSIKTLTLGGYLLPDNIFPQISSSNLINLEKFSYTDMSSHPYISEQDVTHFKRIIELPKIKTLRICRQHLPPEFEDFLDDQEGISWDVEDAEVTFRDNFLPFYEITIQRNRVR